MESYEIGYIFSDEYWSERTYNSIGNVLTFKASSGYWYERIYDKDGRGGKL